VIGDERADLSEDIVLAAGRQQRVEPGLAGGEELLLQRLPGVGGQGADGVRQRWSPPQRPGLGEQAGGVPVSAVRRSFPPGLDELAKLGDVQAVCAQAQFITGGMGDD
jgi:hypothetical protein